MTNKTHNDEALADATTLAKGGSLSLFGSAAGAALSMALLFVVTLGLGADDAGAFFEAIALFSIVAVTVAIGADTGLVRFTARSLALDDPAAERKLLIVSLVPVLVAGLIVMVAGLALAPALGRIFGGEGHSDAVESMVRVLSLIVPAGALNLAVLGATRGYGTMLPTVVAERVGRPLIQLVLGGIAIAAGVSASWLAGAWAIGVVFALVAGVLWLGRLRRRHQGHSAPSTRSYREIATEFWAFTLPRALSSMFRVGVLWLDVLLVGWLMSPRDAAIYTVATRLIQAGALAGDAIGQAVEPMFSSLLAGGHETRTRALYQTSTAWLVGLTWPLYISAWIFAPTVLGLFGAEFSEAAPVVAILAASALLGSGFGPVDVLLVMAGKSIWSLWNSAAALTTNLVLNLLLIPSLGLNGAALAWAISRIVANSLPFIQMRSMLGINPIGVGWKTAAIAAVTSFGVIGLGMRAAFGSSVPIVTIFVVIAVLGYSAIIWRWRHRIELDAFAAMIGGGFGRKSKKAST